MPYDLHGDYYSSNRDAAIDTEINELIAYQREMNTPILNQYIEDLLKLLDEIEEEVKQLKNSNFKKENNE